MKKSITALVLVLTFTLSRPMHAEHYDLYILAGQSNMDGRGDAKDLPQELQNEFEQAIIFYRNPIGDSDGWKKLRPGYSFAPKAKKTLPTDTFGPEIGFASAMLKANPKQPLALIKASRGGTSIRRDWDPGQADQPDSQKPLYRMFIESVGLATKALEKNGHTYTLKGFLWHQGEGDRKMSSENYQQRLETLIARVREDLKSPDLPVVVGEVFDNGERDNTRAAIQATAAASDTVGLVSSEGTTCWDKTTHFDAKSQLLLGERYASEINKPDQPSISGRVVFPKNIPEGINTEGLSLENAIVTLEGKYNHPRRPVPANWQQMTPEQRQAWSNDFNNSDAYAVYQQKVEEARSKRFTVTTEVAANGSFTLENIKPAWYQLTAKIMPPNAPENAGPELARAFALSQFFVRKKNGIHTSGTLTLKLQNVLLPGDEAPDFQFAGYDGKTNQLSDFRGKYVLVDFWATWCGPCIAQIPNLEAIHEEFDAERLAILGLSTDQKQEDANAFLEKRPSQYQQGYAGSEALYTPISTAYGITSIPSIWLIDPEGNIVARDLMGQSIKEAVAKALNDTSKKQAQ